MFRFVKIYFELSKWQGISIIVLLLCILGLSAATYFLPFYQPNTINQDEQIALQELASKIHVDTNANSFTKKYDQLAIANAVNIKPFRFNPNTLSEADFKKLGLREKTVSIILNYRNKNGKFYTKADVEKMYSLSQEEFKILEPFIDLPDKKEFTQNSFTKKIYAPISVEINTADTAQFNALRGIGPTLAQRIVDYRKQIGGFYSISQIKEVYGISDSTFKIIQAQLKVDKNKIQKINVNTVSFQALSVHPYFKNGAALAILKYRKNHNNHISNWEEIKNLPELKPEMLEKISIYLSY